MSRPSLGFHHETRKSGEVIISRDGNVLTTLRGPTAETFLRDIEHVDPQPVVARVTGNCRRGNERDGRRHERNR
ncbi:MAG: hypothetical protein ACRD08_05245 [Acidimicrobiales bacterium]